MERFSDKHTRIEAMRSTITDLRSNIRALEETLPRLEQTLAERVQRSASFNPANGNIQEIREHLRSQAGHKDVQATFSELRANVDAMRAAVPALERAVESQRSRSSANGVASDGQADLPEYLRDLRRRLNNLRDIVPQLEMVLAANLAGAVARAGQPLPAFSQANYLRVYLNDLRARVDALQGIAPRLEKAFVAGVAEVSIPEVHAPVVVAPPARAGVVIEPTPYIRARLSAGWFSRARLRGLALAVAALALLIGFGTAWFFNPTYARQRYAQQTVFRMQNAPSYRAIGLDTMSFSISKPQEVREEFQFVAPDQVWTKYLTSGANVQCTNKDIIVISSTRYQRCNDVDAPDYLKKWNPDAYDPTVFNTALFQPWIRFAWCHDFREAAGKQVINGVSNRLYSCRVPNTREADIIFSTRGENVEALSIKDAQQREKFLKEASVDITIWVRETDGYIGRFAMKKYDPRVNNGRETLQEMVDYQYTDFGKIDSIRPPSDNVAAVGSASAASSGASTGSSSSATGATGAPQEGGDPLAQSRFAVLNGRSLRLEVAADAGTLKKGLSNRPILSRDTGMLFILPEESTWTFWMKDVLIPLDVLFLSSDREIVDIQTMQAQPTAKDDELRLYQSRAPALYAIEMNAGLATEMGLATGMKVEFRK